MRNLTYHFESLEKERLEVTNRDFKFMALFEVLLRNFKVITRFHF